MELPIVQYKRHRVAYVFLACIGLLVIVQGAFWFAADAYSVGAWIFIIAGLLVCISCGWKAFGKTIVLELNHEGIQHKGDLYGWNTLSGYGIRKELWESSSATFLILRFHEYQTPVEIQLDWLYNMETIPDHMAIYASAFKLSFDGVIKKEV